MPRLAILLCEPGDIDYGSEETRKLLELKPEDKLWIFSGVRRIGLSDTGKPDDCQWLPPEQLPTISGGFTCIQCVENQASVYNAPTLDGLVELMQRVFTATGE